MFSAIPKVLLILRSYNREKRAIEIQFIVINNLSDCTDSNQIRIDEIP